MSAETEENQEHINHNGQSSGHLKNENSATSVNDFSNSCNVLMIIYNQMDMCITLWPEPPFRTVYQHSLTNLNTISILSHCDYRMLSHSVKCLNQNCQNSIQIKRIKAA